METIMFDLNYLDDCSQQELNSYRKLGSVRSLKRLRQKEKRRMERVSKAASAILGAVFAIDLWIFLSWIDIITHNTQPDAVYRVWNFFTLVF